MGKKQTKFERTLIQSLGEALEHARGTETLKATEIAIPDPPPSYSPRRIVALRRRLGDTRTQFAARLNVSPRTVEGWERGARRPVGSATRLLQIYDSSKERL